MKILVDANIIISALIKDSKIRELLIKKRFEFVSPDFILEEIDKYKDYICEKSGLSKEEFELLITLIFENIKIIPKEEYETYLEKAKEIMKEDIKDITYVACYFALRCDYLWTNDSDFDNNKDIKIINIKELLEL